MNRTTHQNTILMCALLSVLVAGQAMAATIRYQASGEYFDTFAVTGTHGWQSPGVPGILDTARFNWASNTVTLAGVAPTIGRFQMGVDESGGLVVNSGGSLTATNTCMVGNNAGGGGANPTTGFLTINSGGVVNAQGGWLKLGNTAAASPGVLKGVVTLNGGSLNVSGHLWVGAVANSIGTIDVNNGGTLNVGGMLGLGTVDAINPSGGTGLLSVNSGGLLALSNIHSGGSQGSIQPGSLLDITGTGQVTLPGDFVSVVNGYITAARISGNGVPGNAVAVFDGGQNKTLITAIPEPSTFALLALTGFGLAVYRLGRKG